jgi:multidrug transporter EmrE-like cation transporter
MRLSPFWKTVVAAIGAAAIAVKAALVGDELISTQEWVEIGLAVATVIGVYIVPNREPSN